MSVEHKDETTNNLGFPNTIYGVIEPEESELDSVEWSDDALDVFFVGDDLHVEIKYHDSYYDEPCETSAVLSKSDVLNLAKALNITAKDLK